MKNTSVAHRLQIDSNVLLNKSQNKMLWHSALSFVKGEQIKIMYSH